jgi:hypothetical protein
LRNLSGRGGLLALVFAAGALAKEGVQVCGPAACVQLADETTPPPWLFGGSGEVWTDARADFRISKTGAYLWRNGLVFKIPAATAKKIRARQPLG